ncbi:lasso peptide biosynthesis B2 protein [Rhodanobacter koreensis]
MNGEAHREVRLALLGLGETEMPGYRLHDDLSFCRIDGRAIFLDTRNDRYFRLSGNLERTFIEHIEGAICTPDDIAPLVERNIITEAPLSSNIKNDSIKIASRSALELSPPSAPCGIGAAVEVLATVWWTQIQLKTRRLKTILDDTIDFRCRATALERGSTEPRLLNDALVFLKARKFVPIETCCLLDSLSIVAFLTRRRLHANIVFGVTSDPFSAHCWAQSGDIVLNDTIGNTQAYAVIRVI